MDVAHLREVFHARGDAAEHPHQLDGRELAVVKLRGGKKFQSENAMTMRDGLRFCHQADPQKRIQGAVLHKLGEDHDRAAGCDDALQVDNVGVLELTHDGRLGQEVAPLLLGVAAFERLYGDVVFFFPGHPQPASAHLAKLSCRDTSTRLATRHHLEGGVNAKLACSEAWPLL